MPHGELLERDPAIGWRPPQPVADPLRDGPVFRVPRQIRPYYTAVRLREAHPVERIVRILLAALVLAYTLLAAWGWLHRTTNVDAFDQEALLRDAAAGRIVRLDDGVRPDGVRTAVRWRTRNGATYQTQAPAFTDVRASVERQPYVAAHPGSITYGHIAEPPVRFSKESGLVFLVVNGLGLALILSTEPRLLTKWGWYWTFVAWVGVPAYLLFGGSALRGRPGVTERRLNAWQVIAGILVVRTVTAYPLARLDRARHPVSTNGTYVRWVDDHEVTP